MDYMEDGTGMTILEQRCMDRWYDEVGEWCEKLSGADMTPWTAEQEKLLVSMFWQEYSSLSAAEAICGIE